MLEQEQTKQSILLVTSDETLINYIKISLANANSFINVLIAKTLDEVNTIITTNKEIIHLVVVDIDSIRMALKLTSKANLPTIILSTELNEKTKEIIQKYNILDYTIKEKNNYIRNLAIDILRMLKNYTTNILVVDDSVMQLNEAVKLLERNKFNVITAKDGVQAYNIIQKKQINFSLVLTDYNMPNMDGMELTRKIREEYNKDELGIIVLSANNDHHTLIEFIKLGANDFINKPYSPVEVNTRVNSNLHTLELFKRTRDMANKDFLTGSYNRRYFFDSGEAIFSKAKRDNKNICVAMFDIDKFKNINDTYGHDIGDIAIKEISKILNVNLRASDLVARFGGEEFCVLLENITKKDSKKLFEKIRLAFEENVLKIDDITIKYTVSIGVSYGISNTLEDMIKQSDEGLYYCKDNGRNQVSYID